MKRWLIRSAIALVGLVAGLFGLQMIASESAEVVVLHAADAGGSIQQTRLWVADLDGRQYLRVGADGSGWFERLRDRPEVEVERGGALAAYLAVPDPDQSTAVNAVMQAKYGWRDTLIGALVGGRDGAIPIRLDPR